MPTNSSDPGSEIVSSVSINGPLNDTPAQMVVPPDGSLQLAVNSYIGNASAIVHSTRGRMSINGHHCHHPKIAETKGASRGR